MPKPKPNIAKHESSKESPAALIAAARQAAKHAYAPYSQFKVGAALLTVSGESIPGMQCRERLIWRNELR